ncbi:serine palmitoyltransferase 1-like [Tropilaelaps mercedesae]|uniref:Serine palmitoyltransferase 1 n=1 Tax=Tropilaelaps mercedesae TaxID=418985 RepID=A0A1V9XQY6_9ACAR|nr:serine palmitoyltransferase 1-like [Tropilaelaps mercedesae]
METITGFVESVYTAPSAQLAFELILVLLLVWTLKRGPASQATQARRMTDREVNEVLAAFQPEPLCGVMPDRQAIPPRVLSGRVGRYVTVNGKPLLNVATHNYLGLGDRKDSTDKAIHALRNYGVGSCGPRGFYGTADVHLELEARLAAFMGVEEACLYSYGFSAISSAIPSYSKPHDVIFADEQVNFSIQQGIIASRSTVYYFEHNNPDDLERLLRAQDERDRRRPKNAKRIRRFLILEGIYMNTGTLVNLPALVKLRAQYKCRLFIDESLSFGVLGRTGKGVREHFGVPNSEIDLISATLENAVSSYGGFLCGSHFLMEHQRLYGLAYCFSASLPPLQAVVTLSHLDIISREPESMERLRQNCHTVYHRLKREVKGLLNGSHPLSPVKHLYLEVSPVDAQAAKAKLDEIVAFAEERGVALTRSSYLEGKELMAHTASIRLTVGSFLTAEDIGLVIEVLRDACRKLCINRFPFIDDVEPLGFMDECCEDVYKPSSTCKVICAAALLALHVGQPDTANPFERQRLVRNAAQSANPSSKLTKSVTDGYTEGIGGTTAQKPVPCLQSAFTRLHPALDRLFQHRSMQLIKVKCQEAECVLLREQHADTCTLVHVQCSQRRRRPAETARDIMSRLSNEVSYRSVNTRSTGT